MLQRFITIKKATAGFTMFEIIVSISLFVIIIILTSSMFTIAQRAYTTGANQSELSQNIRVALNRISREVRQSQTIVTDLTATSSELFFQDGHNPDQITYIRYYLDGTDLIRAHEAYYFLSDPGVYVIWDSVDFSSNTTTKIILDASDNVTGEFFQSLQFWGTQKLVNITMDLINGQKNMRIDSSVFSRNY